MSVRVRVVGGGIAGTTAALALARVGADVDVYEAEPSGGDEPGAFLTLASNGMAALVGLGVADVVASAGFALTSIRVRDAAGVEVTNRSLGDPADLATMYCCLRRVDLVNVLRQQLAARGIAIHHGERFVEGSSVDADLLVGADGLWSAVRQTIDPHAAPPRDVGQYVFYGFTDSVDAGTPHCFDAYPGEGGNGFGMFRAPTGRVYWYARVRGEGLEVPDGVPAAVVAATDRVVETRARDLPSVRRWRTDRAVLVGDAAHAASPASGQGASLAFEDALVLGEAVREEPTLDAALLRYERLRRPPTERNVAESARLSGLS